MAKKNWSQIDVSTLDFTDKKTWDMLSKGETSGVFQLESSGMTEACVRLQPRSMEDLIALIALYRPDTMGELEHFIKRKNGEEEITYIHPDMIPILEKTYGCLIYQEQIMTITKVFAGFSDGEADKFRKGIGKKNKALVQEQADKFYGRCIQQGYSPEIALEITEILRAMGGYSFNKGHATGYAITCFKTAFLKANNLAKYMCSLLSNQKKSNGQTDYEKISIYIARALDLGIKVLAPDVNLSQTRFSEKDGSIIYGLGLVKGLGKSAINMIMSSRPFNSFEDFLDKCQGKGDVNKTNIVSLIKSGAFDFTGRDRKDLLYQYEDYRFTRKLDTKHNPVSVINQKHIDEMLDANIIKPYEATDKAFCLKMCNKWKKAKHRELFEEEQMAGDIYLWEYDSICFHLSGDPFEGVELPSWDDYEEDTSDCLLGGTIIAIKKTKIKKGKQTGKQMAFLSVSTKEGLRDVTVFAGEYERFQEQLTKGTNVVFKGKKQGEGMIMAGMKVLVKE